MKSCLVHCSIGAEPPIGVIRDLRATKQFLLFMLDLTPSTSVWLQQMARNLWIFGRICFPLDALSGSHDILYFLTGFESSSNIATRPNVHACKCWWTSIGAFVSPSKKVQHWISSLNTKLAFDEHHIKAVVNSNDRNTPWFLHVYLSWRYIWFQLNTKHRLWCIFGSWNGHCESFPEDRRLFRLDSIQWSGLHGPWVKFFRSAFWVSWVGPAWPHGRKSNDCIIII